MTNEKSMNFNLRFACCKLKDTPMSLMSRNKTDAAEKSLKFYKNCSDESKENVDRFETEKAKLYSTIKASQEKGEKLVWADFSKFVNRLNVIPQINQIYPKTSDQRSTCWHGKRTMRSTAEHILRFPGTVELCIHFILEFGICS